MKFSILILVVAIIGFHNVYYCDCKSCCMNNGILNENGTCINTLVPNISISCKYPEAVLFTNNSIDRDGFLHVGLSIVPPKSFCTNNETAKNSSVRMVALFCAEDAGIEPETYKYHYTFFDYLSIVIHIISIIGFLLTGLVYLKGNGLTDTQDVCVAHFCLCFVVAKVDSVLISNGIMSELGELCITHEYLYHFANEAAYLWMCILSYDVWYTARTGQKSTIKAAFFYRLICYGIPTIFLILFYILANLTRLYDTYNSELACAYHGAFLISLYVGFVCILLLLNGFFFIDSFRRMWVTSNQCEDLSKSKLIKYRCFLYMKLFVITGVPILFLEVVLLFHNSIFLMNILLYFDQLQGTLVFVIMVITRKKAFRAFGEVEISGVHLVPEKWRRIPESNTEEEENIIADEEE